MLGRHSASELHQFYIKAITSSASWLNTFIIVIRTKLSCLDGRDLYVILSFDPHKVLYCVHVVR